RTGGRHGRPRIGDRRRHRSARPVAGDRGGGRHPRRAVRRLQRLPLLRRPPVVPRRERRPRGGLPGDPRRALRDRALTRGRGHRARRDRGRAPPNVPRPRGGDQLREPRCSARRRRTDAPRPQETEQGERMSAAIASATTQRGPRRRTGFAAVLIAVAASVLAYGLQGLGVEGERPTNLVAYGIGFAVLAFGGWYAVRRSARGADPILYPTAVLLGGLGLAMLYRLMSARGFPGFATEQAVWLAVGLLAFVVTLFVVRDVRQLDAYTYTIGLAGLVLLLLPIVPGVGSEINGARLWVDLGFVRFQPAEIGRILIVIFLASYLGQRRELLAAGVGRLGLPRPKDLGPIILAWSASLAVLFLERDLGASLLLFGVFIVMLWVATGRWAYLLLGLILFTLGAYIGYLAFSHVQVRVDAWIHAMDPNMVGDEGYQLSQGWFALASGGMVGAGLGLGS